jgi:hypothetical protein
MAGRFDTGKVDAMAMPVMPVEPDIFDIARYADWAAAADHRFAEFLAREEGIAVWQRVRVAEVFLDGCRDMKESLRWQLGGMTRSLDYLTDVPGYLEPWYGIGTTASAFGAEYEWFEGQAPVVRPLYSAVQDVPELVPLESDPAHNKCEEFRDTFAGTGVIVQARMVGEAGEVLSRVKRLWAPGMKLIVGTHVQDPQEQHRLYHEIHQLCS